MKIPEPPIDPPDPDPEWEVQIAVVLRIWVQARDAEEAAEWGAREAESLSCEFDVVEVGDVEVLAKV